MTGIEAIEALKDGKSIRGIKWHPRIFIYLNEKGIMTDHLGYPASLTPSCFLEDNWEIYNGEIVGTRMIKVIELKIEKLKKELQEIGEKEKEKVRELKDENIKLIKAKYNLTEKRMNSKFKIKNEFYVNDVFGKIEFDNKGSENILIYKINKNGNVSEKYIYVYHGWLNDAIWLDEINTDKEDK